MAKSLRSKWKRKMRAVKRERYGAKELTRLNEMLEKAGDIQFKPEIKEEADADADAAMNVDDGDVQVIQPGAFIPLQKTKKASTRIDRRQRGKDRRSRKQSTGPEGDSVGNNVPEKMSVDGVERVFNKRSMRDQFGNYPDWMNKRKMRTQQKKNKRLKRARAISVKRK